MMSRTADYLGAMVVALALTAFGIAAFPPAAPAQSSSPRIAVVHTISAALDVFEDSQQVFTLTNTPSADGPVSVFVNGLLMLAGTDYTLAGATLTFTAQEIGDSPVIQVQYWIAN